MVIYKTINVINGKFYIGQDSKNNPNYLGSGILLQRAILKYGRNNFKKEILETCNSKEELNEREIYWIKKLNAIKEGYNIATGGEGGNTLSNHPDLDKITKMVWAKRRSNPNFKKRCKEISLKTAETRKKIGYKSWNKGISNSQETKDKISDTLKKNISREIRDDIIQLYKDGKTKVEIIKKYKFSLKLLDRILYEELKICKQIHQKVDYDEFFKLIDDGFTVNSLSVKYNCEKKRIKQILKMKYNIKGVLKRNIPIKEQLK